jgi:hypothetical protein
VLWALPGIEWDAVEVASQFLEYWVELDRRTVYSTPWRHHQGTHGTKGPTAYLEDSFYPDWSTPRCGRLVAKIGLQTPSH